MYQCLLSQQALALSQVVGKFRVAGAQGRGGPLSGLTLPNLPSP